MILGRRKEVWAPKKPDRKWMNIKNISFEKQCTHFSLQTEFLQLMLCTGEVQNNEEIPNISRSKLYNVLHELKFK
jgi:hypothetical protein